MTATISPARIVSRAKSPRPSIGLVRFSVLGLSQLLMVGPSRVRSERLPELKHVAVVVVDRKLPHPVLEVLHRIADARPGLEPLPQAFDVSVLTYSDPVRAAAVAPSWRFGDETMMVTLSQRREERVIEAS